MAPKLTDLSTHLHTSIHGGMVKLDAPALDKPRIFLILIFSLFFFISVILFIQGCGGSHVNTWWPVSIVSATPHVLFILLLSNQLHSQRRPTDAMSAPPRRSTTTSYLIFFGQGVGSDERTARRTISRMAYDATLFLNKRANGIYHYKIH